MGAYCRPRWAQSGKRQGRLEMKKKARVTTVTACGTSRRGVSVRVAVAVRRTA